MGIHMDIHTLSSSQPRSRGAALPCSSSSMVKTSAGDAEAPARSRGLVREAAHAMMAPEEAWPREPALGTCPENLYHMVNMWYIYLCAFLSKCQPPRVQKHCAAVLPLASAPSRSALRAAELSSAPGSFFRREEAPAAPAAPAPKPPRSPRFALWPATLAFRSGDQAASSGDGGASGDGPASSSSKAG